MGDFIARTSGYTHRIVLMEKIEEKVKYLTRYRCVAITNDAVELEDRSSVKTRIPADTVVLCLGSEPLLDEADAFRDVSIDYVSIGDSVHAINVRHAIRTGYDAAARL